MEQYLSLDYPLTMLEIQKLAYLLQAVGEPLRLQFIQESRDLTPPTYIQFCASSKDTPSRAIE
jgi:hypothetical protein